MTADIEIVCEGLRYPEGPVALSDGTVLLVEIASGSLSRVARDGSRSVVAFLGGGPNGAALGPDGACYVCNNGGFAWLETEGHLRPTGQPPDYSGGRIERVDLDTGEVSVLYRECEGIPLRGPNDLVFDAHGGFYFTDFGKGRADDLDRGRVYYARADGSHIRSVIFPMLQPNGIGLSPDGKTLYVAETESGRLWRFAIESPGHVALLPHPSPNGGELVIGLPGYQRFDSLKVEAGGNICVATINNGGISVISPEGVLVEHVPMPDYATTNLCFAGADARTVYVTLSSSGRLVKCHWPRAGLPLQHAR